MQDFFFASNFLLLGFSSLLEQNFILQTNSFFCEGEGPKGYNFSTPDNFLNLRKKADRYRLRPLNCLESLGTEFDEVAIIISLESLEYRSTDLL